MQVGDSRELQLHIRRICPRLYNKVIFHPLLTFTEDGMNTIPDICIAQALLHGNIPDEIFSLQHIGLPHAAPHGRAHAVQSQIRISAHKAHPVSEGLGFLSIYHSCTNFVAHKKVGGLSVYRHILVSSFMLADVLFKEQALRCLRQLPFRHGIAGRRLPPQLMPAADEQQT